MSNLVGESTPAPNFVVVVTDDQGPWALPWRMPELHMPELEQLAADGCELTAAYCASPVCSPARASMLTGMMPSAHGIHDWLMGEGHPDSFPDTYLDGLHTTPELLAEAGYDCAMIGKWHLGNSRYPARGFSTWYAHRIGGAPTGTPPSGKMSTRQPNPTTLRARWGIGPSSLFPARQNLTGRSFAGWR